MQLEGEEQMMGKVSLDLDPSSGRSDFLFSVYLYLYAYYIYIYIDR